MVFLRSNTRSNEVHRVASWSTRGAAECTSWCHEVYFITSSVASQDIQRVVDKKTNEASAELVFLSTTRWISHQIERVGKQREESIKPRAEGEWFYAFLELFANEFNLVEKPPHARDFRSSILELYHNRKMRSTHKHVLPSVKGSSWSEERSPPHQTAAYDRSSPCRISAEDRSSPRQMMSVDEFSPTGRDY